MSWWLHVVLNFDGFFSPLTDECWLAQDETSHSQSSQYKHFTGQRWWLQTCLGIVNSSRHQRLVTSLGHLTLKRLKRFRLWPRIKIWWNDHLRCAPRIINLLNLFYSYSFPRQTDSSFPKMHWSMSAEKTTKKSQCCTLNKCLFICHVLYGRLCEGTIHSFWQWKPKPTISKPNWRNCAAWWKPVLSGCFLTWQPRDRHVCLMWKWPICWGPPSLSVRERTMICRGGCWKSRNLYVDLASKHLNWNFHSKLNFGWHL